MEIIPTLEEAHVLMFIVTAAFLAAMSLVLLAGLVLLRGKVAQHVRREL